MPKVTVHEKTFSAKYFSTIRHSVSATMIRMLHYDSFMLKLKNEHIFVLPPYFWAFRTWRIVVNYTVKRLRYDKKQVTSASKERKTTQKRSCTVSERKRSQTVTLFAATGWKDIL